MSLGSGIRKKPIPDPGVKNAPDPGSRIPDPRSRIPDPDPQHWYTTHKTFLHISTISCF